MPLALPNLDRSGLAKEVSIALSHKYEVGGMNDKAPITRHLTQDFCVIVDCTLFEKSLDNPADRHPRFNGVEEH